MDTDLKGLFWWLKKRSPDFLPGMLCAPEWLLESCIHAKWIQSCPSLCDLVDCSLSDSSVPEIFQSWILEWVAISFSRRSSEPRNRTCVSHVSCIEGELSTSWAIRKAPFRHSYHQIRETPSIISVSSDFSLFQVRVNLILFFPAHHWLCFLFIYLGNMSLFTFLIHLIF